MGSLTSKHVDEVMDGSEEKFSTPKSGHVLPFDPRSPTDYISRTPITITETPDKSQASTPMNSEASTPMNSEKVIKVLDLDPRSPCEETCRTPIVIEEEQTRRRHQPFKPSNLTQIINQEIDDSEDPRSPSSKVPRTPFEEQTCGFPGPTISKTEDHEDEQNDENGDQDLVKKLFPDESDPEKVRQPLTSVQNTAGGPKKGPLSILQAKQCKTVEEEFCKNQGNLILQLATDQENTTEEVIPAATDFVDNI